MPLQPSGLLRSGLDATVHGNNDRLLHSKYLLVHLHSEVVLLLLRSRGMLVTFYSTSGGTCNVRMLTGRIKFDQRRNYHQA